MKNCLLYCCIFPESYWIAKGKLIRLLVAEDLINKKAGKVMEDIAEENIYELVDQRMLHIANKQAGAGTKLQVPSPYREFCLHRIEEGNFRTSSLNSESSNPQLARRVVTNSDLPEIDNLPLQSLFLIGNQKPYEEKDCWLKLSGTKFLRVLDLENTKMESLPDEVQDMIHLRYLGLKHTEVTELPAGVGNLIALQTLDIRWCGRIEALPKEVLNLVKLRHLKMFKSTGFCGVMLPKGIGRLTNLLTLTGINVSGGIAKELGKLTQLRRLGVVDVAEDCISDLLSSMANMQGLLSLSLAAKHTHNQAKLVLLEPFSPPSFLRKLRLEGLLEKIPSWFGSLEKLTNLRLGFSHLSENPALVLQLLPNLKTLTLWHAYDAKQMGKEFCNAGGFPKLEVLSIASHVLEEWTDLEEGALPSLKYLNLHNCLQLRMLPEGLQFVTTLRELRMLPLLDDHAERLKPGGGHENYKIRHIPQVSFITMSTLRQRVTLNYTRCGVQIGRGEAEGEA
ncbi:disease resistance protein RPM1 [Ziziphus jujuba]|uniref:Disease resistance protein RPM1 n=1 Tax=Ziziphus jujuba TaxID=326968 RepID=A0A6P3ZSH9_ZIZJJ|nr:disease resistance protein RPM1 [Ziziphus jujuba]